MFMPMLGLFVGVMLGLFCPFVFPQGYSSYVAIGILACMDSVLGGIRSNLDDNFEIGIFLSGFFGNSFIALFLIWLGNKLNIQLSIAAIVVFGSRLFENFGHIRRFMLNSKGKHDNM